MRSTFAPLLVCASFVGVALGQALIINTPVPAPVTCEPTLITWGGGSPPYIVSLVDADDQTNQLIVFGTDLTTTQLTWNVNVTAGTNCILFVKDSTGLPQNSASFTIQPGPTNCLGGSSSASAPPSSSGSAKPSSTPSSTPASSTPPVTTPSTTPSVTPSVTPSITPSSTKPVSSPPVSSSSPSVSAPSGSSTGAARATGVPAAAAAAALGAVFAALL